MNTSDFQSSNNSSQVRQQLLETIQELPEGLVQELLHFANQLRSRENPSTSVAAHDKEDLKGEASEGYRKMKASGFIGIMEAEPELSTNYKNTLFAELKLTF